MDLAFSAVLNFVVAYTKTYSPTCVLDSERTVHPAGYGVCLPILSST